MFTFLQPVFHSGVGNPLMFYCCNPRHYRYRFQTQLSTTSTYYLFYTPYIYMKDQFVASSVRIFDAIYQNEIGS
jgi:hypothetical protein